jgi:hypothetical protein
MYGFTARRHGMMIRESVVIMQFIYMLKLVPRLVNNDAWTETNHKIVENILKLKELEAQELMENDPAVKEGIMIATLYPL